ncbi:MAG: energy transducer TonB [Uliginosibacterium sp.]|nr:energy transducer TonB [Uliginosibacterium sp.]
MAHAFGLSMGISIAFHSLLPLIGFIPPSGGLKKQRDPGLEVVLVNAKHSKAPQKAQALAQANLDGGGNTDDKKAMPSTPLPPDTDKHDGDSWWRASAGSNSSKRCNAICWRWRNPPTRSTRRKRTTRTRPEVIPARRGVDLTRATAIARQEAVVEKLLKEYAQRPRKAFISPRTQYASHAQYMMSWSSKIARVGELNFPRNTVGSLYGSVQIHVEIRADGSVARAEIARPDKDPKINDAALRVIHIAALLHPFRRKSARNTTSSNSSAR